MSGIDSVLLDFQRDAVGAAMYHRGFLLLMPMGSGKTLTAMQIANRRYRQGRVTRVLVVCQKTLIDQWADNIAEWLPEARVISDPRTILDDDRLTFYITNYEKARELLKQLRKCKFDLMITDECHKLKSRSSKQSRRLWLIGRGIRYRLGLTGTPVEGNELDFWAQMRFIDESVFGSTWGDFTEEWTRPAGFMGKKPKLKESKRRSFLKLVAEKSFTVTEEESLKLLPAIDTLIPVRMGPTQAKAYRQMEDDLVVRLPRVEIASELIITQIMRLQQILGGFIPDEDKVIHRLGSVKIEALKDFLESHTKPVVVYARFIPEIEEIERAVKSVGRTPSIMTGSRKVGTHKRFDVLVCQVGMMAGLDGIQHVTGTAIFYSKPYSRIQYQQARSRLRRRGQKNQVRFYHLVVKNTVDTDLIDSLKEKDDLHNAVVQALIKRRRT